MVRQTKKLTCFLQVSFLLYYKVLYEYLSAMIIFTVSTNLSYFALCFDNLNPKGYSLLVTYQSCLMLSKRSFLLLLFLVIVNVTVHFPKASMEMREMLESGIVFL